MTGAEGCRAVAGWDVAGCGVAGCAGVGLGVVAAGLRGTVPRRLVCAADVMDSVVRRTKERAPRAIFIMETRYFLSG